MLDILNSDTLQLIFWQWYAVLWLLLTKHAFTFWSMVWSYVSNV